MKLYTVVFDGDALLPHMTSGGSTNHTCFARSFVEVEEQDSIYSKSGKVRMFTLPAESKEAAEEVGVQLAEILDDLDLLWSWRKRLRICEDRECEYFGAHYVNCLGCRGFGHARVMIEPGGEVVLKAAVPNEKGIVVAATACHLCGSGIGGFGSSGVH